MKLDLVSPAVPETAARIYAPHPARAGHRPLTGALRGGTRHLDRPHGAPATPSAPTSAHTGTGGSAA